MGYAGLGGFYERIRYAHPAVNPDENNRRLNSYIAYTKTFMAASKFSYVGYYQPRFDASSDYVTLQNFELLIPIYGRLNLSIGLSYSYDTRPPLGVDKSDTVQKTLLSWEF